MHLDVPILIFAFLVGASVCSFLNVCAYRIPKGEDIVFYGSHCGRCGNMLRWYHNVPIISALVLKGRCAFCAAYFGWTHALWEFGFGVFVAGVLAFHGLGLYSFYSIGLFSILYVGAQIDAHYRILPDTVTLGTWLLGLGIAGLGDALGFAWPMGFKASFFTSFLSAGFLWAVAFSFRLIRGYEGLGFGDIKLIGAIGAHVPIDEVFMVIFLASVSGLAYWLLFKLKSDQDERPSIAFGPALIFAFGILWFGGESLKFYVPIF